MSPMEMLINQVMKSLKIDGAQVQSMISEVRGMIAGGYLHAVQANKRLARIEAHMGLSDIEPLPTILVIEHVEKSSDGVGSADGR